MLSMRAVNVLSTRTVNVLSTRTVNLLSTRAVNVLSTRAVNLLSTRAVNMSSMNVIHDRQGHQISIFHIPLRFLYTFLIINSLPKGTNFGTPPFIGFFASRIASKGWRG